MKTLSSPVDQARGLRALIQQRARRSHAIPPHCRSITILSSKGGVGKSVIALNLAVSLAHFGKRVCLLDANAGVGNIDLLCRLNGYWNFGHVVSGARRVSDITLTGPAGVSILPGAFALRDIAAHSPDVQSELLVQLTEIEQQHDVLVIDSGCGLPEWSRGLASCSDDALILTTGEPTAIAEAYATVKALHTVQGLAISVIANRMTDLQSARLIEGLQSTTRTFLRSNLSFGCGIPDDPLVAESVQVRLPLVERNPSSPAARAIRQLAERLIHRPTEVRDTGFFRRTWPMVARSSLVTTETVAENSTVGFKETARIH